ncbi:patatin-like phospholipase family protein [Acidiphilium sp. JA12-A1]|uniref:patatin-like phospholipase family protein n=1 Tax=Acidiphilium sp. JA12-A1 TaxID=1464546 RepID=UPI000461D6E9|nr:patatin-like phospholipase family protein [Acidiphilium sp. JA12-A1]KDM67546.1 alpha-beta hydrolase superfamily [Acidiphilium sp. JA12-A1]
MSVTNKRRSRQPSAATPACATGLRNVLLLQGGGALGAYQAGAYEALAEHAYDPDWIIGVSIGAINASLIVGNPPERRLERLREFWKRVTTPRPGFIPPALSLQVAAEKKLGALNAVLFGQPGFFRPRHPVDFITENPLSFYDTAHLRQTLEELVDFDLINSGTTRLAVGAVQIRTGNMIYFDNAECRITPQHIMASGALPPGFPPVEIDGEAYWDGGLVSNTPLEYMMRCEPRENSLVFQVDLFPARGPMPKTLDGVAEREKDIRYSSRTRYGTDAEKRRQDLRRRVCAFLEKLPPELRDDPIAKHLQEFSCPAQIDVVHLIYRPEHPQGADKDVQFDRTTATERWRHGHEDASRALVAAPWREPHPHELGMRTFDIAKTES